MAQDFHAGAADIDKAKFNAAALENIRINKQLLERINYFMMSPKQRDEESGEFHFILAYNLLRQINYSINNKLIPEEKRQLTLRKMIIRELINIKPPLKLHVQKTYPYRKDWVVDDDNMKLLIEEVEKYQGEIEDYMDIHGLKNPNQEDDGGL